MISKRYIISGRVQGVFFRHNTQKKAVSLGLTGWVKNTSDGNVECVAKGPEEAMKTFEDWLWKGPIAAKVTDVTCEILDEQSFEEFIVRYD